MARPTSLHGPWAQLAETAGGVGRLANYLGVSTMTLWRWSSGNGGPDDRVVDRIAAMGDDAPRAECPYCRRSFPGVLMVVDHVVPIVRGGPDQEHNKVRACATCNGRKCDMLPSEWLGVLAPKPMLDIESDVVAGMLFVVPRGRHARRSPVERRRQITITLSSDSIRKLMTIARRSRIGRSEAIEKMISRWPMPRRPRRVERHPPRRGSIM